MKIPEAQHSISALIDKYHADKQEPPRPHMGASQLGHPCDRWLWLSFRWAVKPTFDGRLLRLFRRGQREEETVIADLRAIGVDVRKATSQHRVSFDGHVSGSLDAIIDSGLPDAPKKKHVVEIKTHNKKSFEDLQKQGVEKAKFEHFVQMQVYMHGTEIDRALYFAVCKDNDEIYTERVRYDQEIAEKYIQRGQRIALSDRMPEPLSTDPSWYQCKWCPAYDFCHQTQLTKESNCRTCANSTARPDSTWQCERWDDRIPVNAQRDGCESHVLHPDLVPWQRKDSDTEWQAIYIIDGKEVRNGERDVNCYSSSELIANASLCASDDATVKDFREMFDAKVVG